jgi:hypothetical protein
LVDKRVLKALEVMAPKKIKQKIEASLSLKEKAANKLGNTIFLC